MPAFYNSEEKNCHFAVWKMEEGLEELMNQSALSVRDLARVNSFTHIARKKEWICIRLLLKKLNHSFSIGYHETGKPFLENSSAHISISHTKDFAGVIISDTHSVGIDLERIHPRIEKIAHKFVSDEEEKFLSGKNRLEKLFVIWGAKEVLFKMHSVGELVFKEHLSVKGFEFAEEGSLVAAISKENLQKTFSLNYKLIGDLLITRCVDR